MAYQQGSIDSEQGAELFAEPEDRQTRPRSRAVLAAVCAIILMGLFAGGLWFAYVQGLRHANVSGGASDVPLIRADERPTKVKPEKPGGMEVPDRDKLIYTQKRAPVEHLLPPPEKPMPRPTAPPTAAAQPDAPPPPAAAPAPSAPSAPPAAPAQSQQPVAKPAVKTASAAAAPAKSATAEAPIKTGGTRIQLGSLHSEDAARQEWDRIKRTNSDLLGSVSATPIRADLGDKGVFYRIQTGPIADADRICGELKRRNIGCILAR
jgi:SPOR domain